MLLGGIFAKVDFDREQLPVLSGHESDSRRLLAIHRPARLGAAEADRFPGDRGRAGHLRLLQATQFESILSASLYAYTVYGAAVTPAVMAVFFWKRATTAGAIASIALGTVVTVGLEPAPADNVGLGRGRGVSGAGRFGGRAWCLVSLAAAPPAEEKWAPFFEPATKESV